MNVNLKNNFYMDDPLWKKILQICTVSFAISEINSQVPPVSLKVELTEFSSVNRVLLLFLSNLLLLLHLLLFSSSSYTFFSSCFCSQLDCDLSFPSITPKKSERRTKHMRICHCASYYSEWSRLWKQIMWTFYALGMFGSFVKTEFVKSWINCI